MKLRVFALVTVLFAALGALSPSQGAVAVGFSVGFAPPPLVVYTPPPVPFAGAIWTPGYWAWSPVYGTYYWVPGAWVRPPGIGLYWTPPWWGFDNGFYGFHDGYWGPSVGFYGGINYGYGYFGSGYWGGRWDGDVFAYNTAVVRVNRSVVTKTFVDRSVLNKATTTRRASFNGPGGVQAQPTAEQRAAAENARKAGPTEQQLARREAAAKDTRLHAKENKGHVNSDAIRAFDKKHQQAEGGTSEGAGGREAGATAETKRGTAPQTEARRGGKPEHATDATAETKRGTEKTTGARSTNRERGGGAETKTKSTHERGGAQTVDRGSRGRSTEHRPTDFRSTKTKPHENFNAVNRHQTYAQPHRPQTAAGRPVTTGRPQQPKQPQGGQQQQQEKKKKKPANDQGR